MKYADLLLRNDDRHIRVMREKAEKEHQEEHSKTGRCASLERS